MLHIFIDTNILLSFYSFTQDDLARLEQLPAQGEAGAFEILTTSHVEQEFWRRREGTIADSRKAMTSQRLDMRLPMLCEPYDETDDLRSLAGKYSDLHTQLLKRLDEDAQTGSLKADHLVQRFFKGAQRLKVTPKIIDKARVRIDLGNPPGKRRSIGDAVNWETLLAFDSDDDLIFVTDDGDFYSPLNPAQPREFLLREWEEVVGEPITFVRRLSALPEPVPRDVLPLDDARDEVDDLVIALRSSGSFARTHSLIAELARIPQFTPWQVSELVAALENSQVRAITTDHDVRAFYERLLEKYGSDLPAADLVELEEALERPEEESDDDVPF
jgi:hypothetical protein